MTETQIEKDLHGCAIAVRSLHSSFDGPGGLCVKHGDLRGTFENPLSRRMTRAWSGVAVLVDVMCHVDIVRKVIGTRRELRIAREVSCNASRTVSIV